jgi:hypothetical protein
LFGGPEPGREPWNNGLKENYKTSWSKLIVAVGFVVGCTSAPAPEPTGTGTETGTEIDEVGTSCGNHRCDLVLHENCVTCPVDCGPCQPRCGDGVCAHTSAENCSNCPADCGTCPPPDPGCGDGVCAFTSAENCSNCQADCGCAAGYLCQNTSVSGFICDGHIVGDGICAATSDSNSEDCFNSPSDCACRAGTGCALFVQDVFGVPVHGCVGCGLNTSGCFDTNGQPCDPCTSSCTCPF